MSFHLYTINELYSNADGSNQFIELTVDDYDGQGFWAGHYGGNGTLPDTPGNDSLQSSAGNDSIDGGAGIDSVAYSGTRSHYAVTKTATGYTVTDNVTTDGTDTLVNVEQLKFTDMTVNLTIQAKVAAAPQADVQRITELYVTFFNRVPDADGLSYWNGELTSGRASHGSLVSDILDSAHTFKNDAIALIGIQGVSTAGTSASSPDMPSSPYNYGY